ncbi:MAG: hypothetical protein WC565_08360 [Parcubacteria group bacterium]
MAYRKIIDGEQFVKALAAAGVIPDEYMVRRVIIDCTVGEVVKIYIEEFGTEEMLHLIAPELKEAQVTTISRKVG